MIMGRGTSRFRHFCLFILIVGLTLAPAAPASAREAFCPGGTGADPAVLWCDDFDDGVAVSQKYFDYDDNGGEFVPVAGKGLNATYAIRAKWQTGEYGAGTMARTFGRSPVNSQSHSGTDFREIFWRMYVKTEAGWSGNPYKLSRATIMASSSWAQAMIAHVWGDGVGNTLMLDPATGIDASGTLRTTTYNDFANLVWLGARRATTDIFSSAAAEKWSCVEAHVKLNTSGSANGVFELWIDGSAQASRADLNWVGTWNTYGINAVLFENYWNGGAPGARVRYFDNIVISQKRIGCLDEAPVPPQNLRRQ